MTAIPEPSEIILHARAARRRDFALAYDIAALTPAQVRGALYWLAADPDGVIHKAVTAAVKGQMAADETWAGGEECLYCRSQDAPLMRTRAGIQCADGVECARRQKSAKAGAA